MPQGIAFLCGNWGKTTSYFLLAEELPDLRNALLDRKTVGIEAEVVIARVIPGLAGVVFIVFLTTTVEAANARFRLLFRDVRTRGLMRDAGRLRRADEYAQDMRLIAQDEVRAAPNDDAGALPGELGDDLRLVIEEVLIRGEIVAFRRDELSVVDISGNAID